MGKVFLDTRQLCADNIQIPPDMLPALRSDHAGETGAVYIYRGILAVTRAPDVRSFACHHLATEQRHLETEQRHLEIMSQLLPREQHSRLLSLWRLAGWLTGMLPALFGPLAVYRTIDAVESFVDRHYEEQIELLRVRSSHQALRTLLQSCRDDELLHRDEARSHLQPAGPVGRLWERMVGAGSRAGVYLASRY